MKAMDELLKLYEDKDYLVRRTRRFCLNYQMAEDVIQEAFLKAFRRIDKFDPSRGTMKGWMNRQIMDALAAVKWRERQTFVDILELEISDGWGREEPLPTKNLDEKDEKIVDNRYRLGYTTREASKVAGLKEWRVREITRSFKKGVKNGGI